MKFFKFLSTVCLLSIGCANNVAWVAPTVNGTMQIKKTVTICIGSIEFAKNADVKALEKAILSWDRVLYNWRRVIPSDGIIDCNVNVMLLESRRESDPKSGLAWANELGGNTIFILKSTIDEGYNLNHILAHELGHIFGAQHVQNSLMNPEYDSCYVCPDVTTVAQVAAYNKINLELLSWCY